MSDSITKICTKCSLELPANNTFFYRKERGLYGLMSVCKSCHNKRCVTYARNWSQRNPEKQAEASRNHERRNRKRKNEVKRIWRKANPDKAQVAFHRRRARIRNTTGTCTAKDIQVQLRMQTDSKGKLRCWWCGKIIKGGYHIDHRIPLSRGGSNDARNICITHAKCNLSKNDRLPHEWNGRLL